MPASPRIVLVGLGHAHIELIRRAARFRDAGCELTLIAPGDFHYSATAAGVLSGALEPEDGRIDAAALAARFGVTHVRDRVVAVDGDQRQVVLSNDDRARFDCLSLNTGSRAEPAGLIAMGATPVKPISKLAVLAARMRAAKGRLSVIVLGGGATGVEMAANLAALATRLGARPKVALVSAGPMLSGWPTGARRAVERVLAERGVDWIEDEAAALSPGAIAFESGASRRADVVLAAGGLEANLPEGLGAPAHGLEVSETLQWVRDSAVFAAGDCARMRGHERPRLGVFGVRAAPVLMDNLIAAARGTGAMRRYRPQSRWLSILDLGAGFGVARYGRFSMSGRPVLSLKRWIDMRFMARYRS